MVVQTGRRAARALPWLRLLALLPISLLIGHDVVFLSQFGLGDDFRRAMTGGGHDGYWMAFSFVITALATGLLVRETVRAARLSARLRRNADAAPIAEDGGYRREFRSIWPALFVATALGFALMENLEHLALGQTPHGLGALIGTEHPMAVPILALVTAGIASIGALIRWRLRVLEARIAGQTAREQRLRGPRSLAPAREWLAAGTLRPIAWFLVRKDAGRAPPSAT